MPRRPRHKYRRRERGNYPGSMIDRYMRSPYDPDNSRNFWGYVLSRTIANPPHRGPGRWFAWILAISLTSTSAVAFVFIATSDGMSMLVSIVFGIAGVVLLLRLLSGRPS